MRSRASLASLILLAGSAVVSLLVAEIVIRVSLGPELTAPIDERSLLYRYDAELGWFPIENSQRPFTGSQTIHVEHNQDGFRDRGRGVKVEPRILFLGDSFVWGYDVEASDRFTERLAEAMPHWEILNLGVSGYGTDQELVLLRKYFERYQPDIVFVVLCQDNDIADNRANVNFGGYYKPYFVMDGSTLELRGVPVPKSLNYYYSENPRRAQSYLLRAIARLYFQRRSPPLLIELPDPTLAILEEMRSYVESRGARFRIGLQGTIGPLSLALLRKNLRFVHLTNPYHFSEMGEHWTPEGHAFVADTIHEYLIREGLVPR